MLYNYWKKNARRHLGKTIAGTVLLSLLCCVELASGTTYNSTGTSGDVQIKINQASNGDTVTLPAGSFIWTSGVTCSKGITISGAGGGRVEGTSTSSMAIGTGTKTFTIRAGSTITGFNVGEPVTAHVKYYSTKSMTGTVTSWNGTTLVLNVTSSAGSGTEAVWVFEMPGPTTTTIVHNASTANLFDVTESTFNSFDISGIRFTSGTINNHYVLVSPVSNGKPALIHDCRFSSNVASDPVRIADNKGVVYRCYFDRGFNWFDGDTNSLDNSNGVHVENGVGASNAWSTTNYMGNLDTDGMHNFYLEDCFFTGYHQGIVDFHNSVRGVIRHCVLDNSAITTHGPDTAAEGVRHTEVYDCVGIFDTAGSPNTWPANMNYWITWRGGSGVFTDNSFDDITSWAWGNKTEVSLECQMINRNSGPYACWSGGYPVPHQIGQGNSGVEGNYVWNNSTGVTVGLSQYVPDECGKGRLVGDYIKLGRDYFTSAKSGYTKYTYPHPLRGDGTPPSAPQDLMIVP